MNDYEYQGERDRNRENKARQGWAWGTATSTGQGTFFFKKRINFGVSFYEKPMFSYGLLLPDVDPDDTANQPIASGFVYEWVQNDLDDYVGAYVGVTVYCPFSTTPATGDNPGGAGAEAGDEPSASSGDTPSCEHHFSFAARAWKAVTDQSGEDL